MTDTKSAGELADFFETVDSIEWSKAGACGERPLKDHERDLIVAALRASEPDETDVLQNDLREMLQALGMNDGAQPRSPHEVFQSALVEMKKQLPPPSVPGVERGKAIRECAHVAERECHKVGTFASINIARAIRALIEQPARKGDGA
jgi:hypothetical protein